MKLVAATLALASAFRMALAKIDNPVVLPEIPTTPPECYASTTTIYQIEKSIAVLGLNYTTPRVYNLCTETDYEIGEIDPADGSIPDGKMFPITFFNPNAHVQCGNFGLPERNCKLLGGPLQVQVTRPDKFFNIGTNTDPGYSFVYIDNVMIKGLTLEEGVVSSDKTYGYNVQGDHPGKLTIEECVFHDNSNWGSVWAGPNPFITEMPSGAPSAMPSGMPSFMPSAVPSVMPSGMPSAMPSMKPSVNETANRRLSEVVDTERHLSGHTDHLTVYVDNCEFEHNVMSADGLENSFGVTFAGLILNGGQQVHVRDCEFMENDFEANVTDADATFMIGAAPGSTMELRRNCFMENSVSMAPVLFDTGVTSAGLISDNYAVNTTFGFESALLNSDFLMEVTSGGSLVDTIPTNLTFSLTGPDATECERNAPTSAPTDSPTKKPTSTSGAFVASGSILTVLAAAASFAFMS